MKKAIFIFLAAVVMAFAVSDGDYYRRQIVSTNGLLLIDYVSKNQQDTITASAIPGGQAPYHITVKDDVIINKVNMILVPRVFDDTTQVNND